MKIKISCLFILLAILSCKEENKKPESKTLDSIEYSMVNNAELYLELSKINSISIGIYKDGKMYTGYYGEIDKGKNNVPNDNSFFEIASVTKSFAGIVTAQAVLDKKIKLDDDIRKYLDGSYLNLEYASRPILIKDLLTHTSSLGRDISKPLTKLFSLDATLEEKNNIKNYDREALLKDLKVYSLDTIPGTRYDYSPVIGPEIMALILENVYGEPYSELLKKQILNKANMRQTKMSLTALEKQNYINGYTDQGQLVEPIVIPMTGAGAGLKSTTPDLLKYIKYLLESDNPVIKEMQKPLFHDKEDEDWYGYFWTLDEGFRHSGGTNGSKNWLIISPEINAGFTVMINSGGDASDDMINGIASRILNDLENYPVKNLYFPVRKEMLKNTEVGTEFYMKLKKEKLQEYDFEDSLILNNIGYELLRRNKNQEAIKVFQLLVSEFPNEGNPYDSLGEAYFINEQYNLSLKNYKKALELNPKNDNAKTMIEEIDEIMLQR